MAMAQATARFLKPVRFGDTITIETEIFEFGRSSFKVKNRALKSGLLCVEGQSTRVWSGRDPADPTQIKGLPIPAEVVALFMKGGN